MALAGVFSPFLPMVLLQVGYAFMNITSKLAMESGMHPLVLVAYRQIFATLALAPFAFFMERKTRPEISMPILCQILLCSLTGATGNQVLYFVGLEYSTPTIACALSNILPAATFVLALPFGQESLGIRTRAGVAKVAGTIVCVSGAMLLSFYHGHIINLGDSRVHWHYADKMENTSSGSRPNQILGPLLLLLSSVAWAAWFVIQARVNEKFPAPYTSTLLMCAMAAVQCGGIAVGFQHHISAWSLGSPIRVVGALYAGIVCSGIGYCVTTWCIQREGPLYASVFSPLLLVIVAVFSWFLLHEKLYVGTVVGSVLIVVGLYAVLWGKKEETIGLKKAETRAMRKLEEGIGGEEKGGLEWYMYKSSSKPTNQTEQSG